MLLLVIMARLERWRSGVPQLLREERPNSNICLSIITRIIVPFNPTLRRIANTQTAGSFNSKHRLGNLGTNLRCVLAEGFAIDSSDML